MIEPLDASAQAQVEAATLDYIERAGSLFQRHFAPIDINFDLSGRAAGMFVFRHGLRYIRYNPWLFAKYFEDNLASTVPHEVAHYVVHEVYGLRGVRPHGREWRAVMASFGADSSVTADFDLTGIPQRRERRFTYRCNCRTHELSARRHNSIVRGHSSYECRYCRTVLKGDSGSTDQRRTL